MTPTMEATTMSDRIDLDDIDPTGIDDYPADASVKLHGPPGTGKTTQSAARVGLLLRDYDYSLSDVAWCTYRTSLAMDTLERFVDWGLIDESQLDSPHQGATRYIYTIHGVANRTVGDLPDPVQPGHRIDFCKRLGVPYLASDPWDDTAGKLLFQVFDWMKNNLLDPAKPADVADCPHIDDLKAEWRGSVPAAWNKWEDYKAQKDVIDFHEMLSAPIDQGVAPTDQVLVIDEYHDATPLMAKLCEYWIDQADITIVAGDPNQVVNAYSGADPRFFEELDLPKILLDRTYRVPEEHWVAATQLLQKAHDVPPVDRHGRGQIIEYRSPTFEKSDETGWHSPSASQPGSPGHIVREYGRDTLFLTRMQMQADGVGHALEQAGVLYTSQSDLHGWNTDSGERRLNLFNALQKLRGFRPGHLNRGYGLNRFDDSAPRNPDNTSLTHEELGVLLNHTHAKFLSQTRSETDDLLDDLEKREESLSVADLDEYVSDEFWTTMTHGPASVQRLNKGAFSDRDRMALQNALTSHENPVSADDISTGVLTIHASKGQEAQDIVVYDGVSRRISREMRESERTRNNEWRTWYVALTRASKRLHIMRDAFRWTSSIIPGDIRGRVKGVAPADD